MSGNKYNTVARRYTTGSQVLDVLIGVRFVENVTFAYTQPNFTTFN